MQVLRDRRGRKVRSCKDCSVDITSRPNAATLCKSCARKRAWRRADRNVEVAPRFLRCPDGWTFERWIDEKMFTRTEPLPELHFDRGAWRPLDLETKGYLCNSP